MELLHKEIISRGDMMTIKRTAEPTEQNQILHFCLKQKCTEEAFKTVCKAFIEVEGNPKMRALGGDMRRMLETGVCVCVRACTLVYVLVGVHMLVNSCVWCGV